MQSLHLLYHELRSEPSRYSYVTPSAEFASHCALYRRLKEESREFVLRPEITFDDGHRSDHALALPILEAHGLRAHFFITAGWTGTDGAYMGWPALRGLVAAGHVIGAHGWSHTLLTHCSPSQLNEELRRPKALLEDKLGIAVTTLSLPGGRSNAQVLRMCGEAGYEQVFTSVPRTAVAGAPLVGRLNLQGGTQTEWIERVLQPESNLLRRLYRVHRAKTAAKAVLGDKLYAAIWSALNGAGPDAAASQARSA